MSKGSIRFDVGDYDSYHKGMTRSIEVCGNCKKPNHFTVINRQRVGNVYQSEVKCKCGNTYWMDEHNFGLFKYILEKEGADIMNKLRLSINQALSRCLRSATPYVCGLAETEAGYQQIEAQIIRLVVNRKITPDEAITIIESEYGE